MNVRTYRTVTERRLALEKDLQVDLSHIKNFSFDEQKASTKNCENMIGSTQVPLGIAGPVLISGEKAGVESYYIPLATTEGALVASVSRGCKALSLTGSVSVYALRAGQTRGPV